MFLLKLHFFAYLSAKVFFKFYALIFIYFTCVFELIYALVTQKAFLGAWVQKMVLTCFQFL